MNRVKELTKKAVYLFGVNHLVLKRDRYSYRHIRGHGLEIGALNRPLPVRRGVRVEYVDRITKKEAVVRFREQSPEISIIAEPTIIDDGFVLSTVEDNSYDFLVANHVLEHSANPLQTLGNWMRVIKPGGIVFTVVPIAEKTFDRGREITSLEHFIRDYELVKKGDIEEFKNRNREHCRDALTISLRNDRLRKGLEPMEFGHEELERRISEMVETSADIHYHAFSVESYREMIDYFCREINRGEIVAFDVNKDEVICLIRKS